jgi:hypothetical protein
MPFSNFSKYLNPVFVETGSYRGDGIQSALDSGFESVYSIEITNKYYSHCVNRFAGKPVFLFRGDSSIILFDVIKNINSRITFWLDGHWSGDDTGFGFDKYPLLLELDQIYRHPIKNHTILIDDVRLFDTQWNIGTIDLIKHKILTINPQYKFSFENGFVVNDVLVAEVA